MFVDHARINVKAGDGGNGVVSFRREKYVAMGGPDGGNGGEGGNVIFQGSGHLTTLTKVARKVHYRAENGKGGEGGNRFGRSGEDIVIEVPLGTLVKEEQSGRVVCDITEEGREYIVAKGGVGGKGNKTFATATNQTPREATEGSPGEEKWLLLELKLMADVGLVGLPNAGKSTLLSRVTKARPKVAAYPFTTLNPKLGIVDYGDFSSVVMADIPGLIEGAHEGQGLGIEFLKHIERTSIILHLIDCASEEAAENYHKIRGELEQFSSELAQKREIVVFTKMDIPEAKEKAPDLAKEIEVDEFYSISSVTGDGLQPLLYKIKQEVEALREEEAPS